MGRTDRALVKMRNYEMGKMPGAGDAAGIFFGAFA